VLLLVLSPPAVAVAAAVAAAASLDLVKLAGAPRDLVIAGLGQQLAGLELLALVELLVAALIVAIGVFCQQPGPVLHPQTQFPSAPVPTGGEQNLVGLQEGGMLLVLSLAEVDSKLASRKLEGIGEMDGKAAAARLVFPGSSLLQQLPAVPERLAD
jgi:hypothetical protein